MSQTTTKTIRQQNDQFRAGEDTIPGRWLVTADLTAHTSENDISPQTLHEIVAAHDDFTEENDPNQEHDFGIFQLAGEQCYWKIDYYTHDLKGGAENPADLNECYRVLTVMLARDY